LPERPPELKPLPPDDVLRPPQAQPQPPKTQPQPPVEPLPPWQEPEFRPSPPLADVWNSLNLDQTATLPWRHRRSFDVGFMPPEMETPSADIPPLWERVTRTAERKIPA